MGFTYSDDSKSVFGRPGDFGWTAPAGQPHRRKDPFAMKPVKADNESPRASPNLREPFVIKENEWLVGVLYQKNGSVLQDIRFHTSKGRRSVWYRGSAKPLIILDEVYVIKNHHVTGVEVQDGELCVPIKLIMEPIPPKAIPLSH